LVMQLLDVKEPGNASAAWAMSCHRSARSVWADCWGWKDGLACMARSRSDRVRGAVLGGQGSGRPSHRDLPAGRVRR